MAKGLAQAKADLVKTEQHIGSLRVQLETAMVRQEALLAFLNLVGEYGMVDSVSTLPMCEPPPEGGQVVAGEGETYKYKGPHFSATGVKR